MKCVTIFNTFSYISFYHLSELGINNKYLVDHPISTSFDIVTKSIFYTIGISFLSEISFEAGCVVNGFLFIANIFYSRK